MLLATGVTALIVMFPTDLRVVARSVVSVVLFSSNLLFWLGTDFSEAYDYFEPKLDEQPLLHTWSLGIEEQFYVIFPLMVLAIWQLGRKRGLLAVLVCATTVSFAVGAWYTTIHPKGVFYLLPTRGWELMLGSMVAFGRTMPSRQSPERALRGISAALGLTMIVFGVLAFTSTTPFPGVYALAPTIGTALILAHGRGTVVGRILSWPPLVGIGLISYSAYLWHQPVFAFVRYAGAEESPSTALAVGLCLLTLVLAYVTWRWVETPFRDRCRMPASIAVGSCAVASVVILLAAIAIGFDSRAGLRTRGQANAVTQRLRALTSDCSLGTTSRASELGCLLDPRSTTAPTFVVIGDSHADALFPAFVRMSQHTHRQGRLIANPACPSLLEVSSNRETAADCRAANARTLAFVTEQRIPRVFLVSRWSRVDSRVLADRMRSTVRAYQDAGALVYIVEQVPEHPLFSRRQYAHAVLLNTFLGRDPAPLIAAWSVTKAQHESEQALRLATFAPYRTDARVKLIDLSDALCPEGTCPAGTATEPYYWDDNHLNTRGALLVSDALERLSMAEDPAP